MCLYTCQLSVGNCFIYYCSRVLTAPFSALYVLPIWFAGFQQDLEIFLCWASRSCAAMSGCITAWAGWCPIHPFTLVSLGFFLVHTHKNSSLPSVIPLTVLHETEGFCGQKDAPFVSMSPDLCLSQANKHHRRQGHKLAWQKAEKEVKQFSIFFGDFTTFHVVCGFAYFWVLQRAICFELVCGVSCWF